MATVVLGEGYADNTDLKEIARLAYKEEYSKDGPPNSLRKSELILAKGIHTLRGVDKGKAWDMVRKDAEWMETYRDSQNYLQRFANTTLLETAESLHQQGRTNAAMRIWAEVGFVTGSGKSQKVARGQWDPFIEKLRPDMAAYHENVDREAALRYIDRLAEKLDDPGMKQAILALKTDFQPGSTNHTIDVMIKAVDYLNGAAAKERNKTADENFNKGQARQKAGRDATRKKTLNAILLTTGLAWLVFCFVFIPAKMLGYKTGHTLVAAALTPIVVSQIMSRLILRGIIKFDLAGEPVAGSIYIGTICALILLALLGALLIAKSKSGKPS